MSGDEGWDVEADLGFLLPDFTVAEADFSAVCDLLATGDNGRVTTTPKPKRKRKPAPRVPYEAQQRQAILNLRTEIKVLEDQVEHSKCAVALQKPATPWEALALRQRLEARRVLQEHQELRAAVELNRSYIDKMIALYRKTPRQQEHLAADWQVYRLPAELIPRRAAIQAIAERQHARKDSAYIMAGLINQAENLLRVRFINRSSPDVVHYEESTHSILPAPHDVVSRAIWHVYSRQEMPRTSNATQVFANGLTTTLSTNGSLNPAGRREPFLCHSQRSELEDASIPAMASGVVINESVWFTVEPVGTSMCRLKYLVRLVFDANNSPIGKFESSIDVSAQSLDAVKLDQTLSDSSLFASPSYIPQAIQHFPGFAPFVYQSIQLKAALRATVFGAMREFQQ
ncbi:unnamed protein product [Aphanomyces euteiches]